MTNSKLLSVVIPVYNRTDLFLRCLKSVLSQTYTPIEIIIIDDASKISIRSYLEKHKTNYPKHIKLIRNSSNLGPATSRNVGIRVANGNYIAFLDSDDVWRTDFASLMIKHIEKSNGQVATCVMKPEFIGNFSYGQRLFYFTLALSRSVYFYLMYFLNNEILNRSFFYMTRLSGMVFKKKVIKNIYFDSKYKAAEDWKFVYECIYKNNSNISILPKTLCNFVFSKRSETLSRTGYFKYYYELLNELPVKVKRSIGIKFFEIYTNFVIWKEQRLKK
jgi:glycosyltransferase involved in cell wall biosynthesis